MFVKHLATLLLLWSCLDICDINFLSHINFLSTHIMTWSLLKYIYILQSIECLILSLPCIDMLPHCCSAVATQSNAKRKSWKQINFERESEISQRKPKSFKRPVSNWKLSLISLTSFKIFFNFYWPKFFVNFFIIFFLDRSNIFMHFIVKFNVKFE